MSGVRSLYRGPVQKGQPTGASAPIRVDDSTSQVKVQSGGAGVTTEYILADNQTLNQGVPTPYIESATAAGAVPGGAASVTTLIKSVTAIANNVATDVFTVTVPNAAHGAAIEVLLLASLGAGGAIGAFQESRVAIGTIVLARTAGVNAVATAVALTNAGDAKVAGSDAAGTLAYGVSSISGAVGAVNTFTIQVTIVNGAGSSTNHTLVAQVALVNSQGSGVTIA
jgi:hypothetical protein